MMDNLNILRDVIVDLSSEVDASRNEIDKVRLSEQRVYASIGEMQSKFDFIRDKMETKLFSGVAEAGPMALSTPQVV